MSEAIKRFNGLSGTVDKKEVKKILVLAGAEGQKALACRLESALKEAEKCKITAFEPGPLALEEIPACDLPGIDHAPHYISNEDFHGLNKAVSPDDIYQMITDKMIALIEEASGKDYQKKWSQKHKSGYMIPFNFETKKHYRGINYNLLTEAGSIILDNPFFMTFKQVKKLKGKVKKGSKGHPVVYFTYLFQFKQKEPNLDFATYDKNKFIAWANSNKEKIEAMKGKKSFSAENLAQFSKMPILKYYNVFSGTDIEGIDFDLESFKTGYVEGNEELANNDPRIEIADLIVENYPTPQPKLKHGGSKAFFDHSDLIQLPEYEDFETALDYYRTLFHELIHSTGTHRRLNRDISGKFGSPAYAKEELVAEFGAVFLSAHAGIMWRTNRNHAEYLKNWSNALKHMKKDNRFYMRASSAAQAAADYVLNYDSKGVPAYQKQIPALADVSGKKKPASADTAKKAVPAKEEKKGLHKFEKGQTVQVSKRWGKTRPGTEGAIKELRKSVHGDPMYAVTVGKDLLFFPENALQHPKKKLSKKELEAANPAPLAKKPKSVSVQTAVADVLRLDKFNVKGITPLKATLIYNLFKNIDLSEGETAADNASDYAIGVLKNDGPLHNYYDSSQEIDLTTLGVEFINAVKNRLESLRNQKHNYALFDGLNGIPHFKTQKEAKKYFLDWAKKHLRGKKYFHPDLQKEVVFNLKGIEHSISKDLTIPKAALIMQAEMMLKNSTLLFSETDKKKRPQGIIFYRMASIGEIAGEEKEVLLTLREGENGVIYYDHEIDGIKKLPSTSEGLKKPAAKRSKEVNSPKRGNKTTKTKPKTQTNGLKSPIDGIIEPKTTAGEASIGGNCRPLLSGKHPKVRSIKHQGEKNPLFAINGETSRFLQAVEKKPIGSVVVTLDGPQGSGKTTALYKFQNDFATAGNRCLFASLEEHPSSNLATDKKDAYLTPAAQENIDTVGSFESYAEFAEIVQHYDCIFIDSWQKLIRMIGAIRLDEDVRKKFNGKVFFVIFQQTTEGRTKGGAEIVFDGDIIIKLEKTPSFADNYAYFDKNRYTTVPIEIIKYMIADGKTVFEGEIPTEAPAQNTVLASTAENGEVYNFKVY